MKTKQELIIDLGKFRTYLSVQTSGVLMNKKLYEDDPEMMESITNFLTHIKDLEQVITILKDN